MRTGGSDTPCDRLLASAAVSDATKRTLREQFQELDPVRLLMGPCARSETYRCSTEPGRRLRKLLVGDDPEGGDLGLETANTSE